MRLFVAIYPPDDVRKDLWQRLGPGRQGLTAIEKWHVTLAFLGEVSEECRPALEEALARVTVPRGRELRLRGGGDFGGRVIWAGVEGELGDLNEAVRAAARGVGVSPDGRPYTPHLTVSYASDDAVRQALDGYAGPSWTLGEIALVRVEPDGAYTTLRTW
ncbi:RNA 2',3'-cyclic phosphodiesterase [Couchioplanes caeruleus]|uniref:RNA 2',3'-cyclic phosphodiesterase n=2 Tax=Couchioplanes caeruleus TaxID=56438 RepID=A0A1K0GTE1_9ACTN|nr:RNA 2',3'-cyclic phosphodiesterase [Couchioplanes caeruleus]OJF12547.1 2'-5' RNA ligase [Couchioplanes caeruleus subsp. caeruleus]ROP30629.1 2'-5' RNA ligase [Couchioplanes caeruleus]